MNLVLSMEEHLLVSVIYREEGRVSTSSVSVEPILSPKLVPARVPHPGHREDPMPPPIDAKVKFIPLESAKSVDFFIKESIMTDSCSSCILLHAEDVQ